MAFYPVKSTISRNLYAARRGFAPLASLIPRQGFLKAVPSNSLRAKLVKM
jgi:hypothetical protein